MLKWENRKRMQALTKYKRELKKSGIEFSDSHKFQKTKMNTESALKKAQLQYEKIQEQKLQKRKERELEMEKKKKKIEEYHEQKKIRYKKLYGNSKPGKMSMKGRLELLLEKVQKVCADTPEVS